MRSASSSAATMDQAKAAALAFQAMAIRRREGPRKLASVVMRRRSWGLMCILVGSLETLVLESRDESVSLARSFGSSLD